MPSVHLCCGKRDSAHLDLLEGTLEAETLRDTTTTTTNEHNNDNINDDNNTTTTTTTTTTHTNTNTYTYTICMYMPAPCQNSVGHNTERLARDTLQL